MQLTLTDFCHTASSDSVVHNGTIQRSYARTIGLVDFYDYSFQNYQFAIPGFGFKTTGATTVPLEADIDQTSHLSLIIQNIENGDIYELDSEKPLYPEAQVVIAETINVTLPDGLPVQFVVDEQANISIQADGGARIEFGEFLTNPIFYDENNPDGIALQNGCPTNE